LPRTLLATVSCLLCLIAAATGAHAASAHGIAMHGDPALPPDFRFFPYVNPEAPKGGRVVLGVQGSFDSLNPSIVRGVPAAGVREFVIESLMARSYDEPFTLYGLLAETVDMPDDRSSITFHLNPAARFSDGTPVTADDVIFSFEILKEKGRPNHRAYFAKVPRVERLSDRDVRFTFDDSGDRELPLILGLMPVIPKHATDPARYEETTLAPPIGSGPYVVSKINAGRSITYTRNPDYWGRDLAVNCGRFNFDEIRFDYFREASALFEAFKSGAIDLRPEDDPSRWATGYDFPAIRSGDVVRKEFDIAIPAGMTALAFNLRRPLFADPRVRQALILLFNFEWTNATLYHGLFKRTESFFERSALSSIGRPADAREKTLLAPFMDSVKPDVLNGVFRFPVGDPGGHNRKNQRAAFRLLTEAGYVLDGGRLVDARTRRPFTFEILATSNTQEPLLLSYARSLEPLGIRARVRVVDGAQYQGRLINYDYDMIQTNWPSSLSPGNEQLFRWSSEAAKTPGTYNFAGVRNPAVDAMIVALLAARSENDFISAVRALDRVLISGDYVIPLFHIPRQWVAYWRHLAHPDKTPQSGYNLDTWWRVAN
jgi:peptide/nickel transport system substrate-binding protein